MAWFGGPTTLVELPDVHGGRRDRRDRRVAPVAGDLTGPAGSPRGRAVGSTRGDPEGARGRDRVRDHRPRGRLEPDRRLLGADQRLRAGAGAQPARPTGATRVGWDFEDEQPGNDARGFSAEGQMPPEVETHLVNAVLTNGARYYVDHAHPELSHAGVRRPAVDRGVRPGRRADPPPLDGGGHRAAARRARRSSSTRTTPTARATATAPTRTTSWTARCRSRRSSRHVMPHFITRQIFTGRRQGRHRGPRPHQRRRAVPAHAARRLLRGGGRPRDDAEAPDRQHPRRAPRRRPEVPPAPRDRRRRQPRPRSPPSSRSAPPRWCCR